MERTTRCAVITLAILLGAFLQGNSTEREIRGKVGYIAGTTVYVDIGREDGIAAGDSLLVIRDGRTIGTVLVFTLASNASSCTPLFPITDMRVGDEVKIEKEIPSDAGESSEAPPPYEKPPKKRKSRLDGSVSVGSVLAQDLTDSGLDFSRPSLSTRIRIREIAGRPLALDVRHRTRYYDRERRIPSSGPEDRWTHQIYRFSLTFQDEEAPYMIQLGRFLPTMPRGIGYIDGLLLKYQTQELFGFGIVGGFRPDNYSAELQFDEKTIGGFTRLDLDLGEGERVDLSAAFTGSYRSGTVDREFFVSEGSYSRNDWFSTSGSVEIDLNRDWKRAMSEKYLDVTSLFLASRFRVTDDLSLNLSYDSRRPPRTVDNRATPDSLFDDSLRRGFHAGASWSVSQRIQVTGSSGIRIREDHDNTVSASGSLRIRDFPAMGLTTSGRFAMFRTMFTRGYRPMIELGLRPLPDLTLDLMGGDTIYDTGGQRSHDPWIGSSLQYWLSRRQFLIIHFSGHLSERLRSAQLSAETGVRF